MKNLIKAGELPWFPVSLVRVGRGNKINKPNQYLCSMLVHNVFLKCITEHETL